MLIQSVGNLSQGASSIGYAGNGVPNVVSGGANSSAPVNASPSPQQTPAQLNSAVNSLNQVMQQSNISLSFSYDTTAQSTVVNVTDTETGQVVTQFPSKAALAIAQAIEQDQKQQGLLLNQKA